MVKLLWCLILLLSAPAYGTDLRGTLVVLNKGDASVTLFDLETGKPAGQVAVGAGPHEVAIAPDGRVAVVANYGQQQGGSTLTVIDVVNARVVRTIDLADAERRYTRPHGIQFLDNRRVAVTVEAQQSLLLVDVEAARIERVLPTQQQVSHMIALAPDRSRAYIANIGSGSLTAVDLRGAAGPTSVPTGRGAEGVDVTPDGREIWVSNREEDTVSIVDAATMRAVASLRAEGFPIRVHITRDGTRALVTVPRRDQLLVFDVARRSLRTSVDMPRAPVETQGRLLGAAFNASTVPIGVVTDGAGRRAYVAQANADQIAIIDLESEKVVGRLSTPREPDGMGWSPVRVAKTPVGQGFIGSSTSVAIGRAASAPWAIGSDSTRDQAVNWSP